MTKTKPSDGKLSPKEAKRQSKLAQKEEKLKSKADRKEEKVSRKLARRQQRSVVAYRSLLERDQAVELLEQILAGIKAGTVSVEHDEQELTIKPAAVVDLRVRASRTFKSETITLRLRWSTTTAAEKLPSIKVSSE